MVRPLREVRGQGLGQLKATLANPRVKFTIQARIRIQGSDAKLPNPRDNPQGRA